MIRNLSVGNTCLALGLLLSLAGTARAAGDPNGTWKWSMAGRGGGQGIDFTMSLKAEGDKLSGKVELGQFGSSDIKNGTFKNDEVAFETVMEFGGNSITTKYKGKVEGDTIKGKIEREGGRGGAPQDWEAKREKK